MTWGNFVSEIENYESDTFTARGQKISRKEAEKVAEILLNAWSLNNLDGVKISGTLDDIRQS